MWSWVGWHRSQSVWMQSLPLPFIAVCPQTDYLTSLSYFGHTVLQGEVWILGIPVIWSGRDTGWTEHIRVITLASSLLWVSRWVRLYKISQDGSGSLGLQPSLTLTTSLIHVIDSALGSYLYSVWEADRRSQVRPGPGFLLSLLMLFPLTATIQILLCMAMTVTVSVYLQEDIHISRAQAPGQPVSEGSSHKYNAKLIY